MLTSKPHFRILVVDDELGMREMLAMELESRGYEVAAASHGNEALEMLQKEKFHLIISDILMPQKDGMALLEAVKKNDPSLEVIMMTGHGTVENAVKAMKMGAYDFVLKPFNLEELMVLVEKALEKQGLKTLVALYESSKAIFSTIKLNELLEIIIDLVLKIHQADEGSLMLLDENQRLSIAASRGIPEETARQTHLEIGERISGLVAKEKRPLLLIDGLERYPELKGIPNNSRIRSSIICPLICNQELMGVLNLSRTKTVVNFIPSDLQSVCIFAAQAALAILNAKLYENLRKAYQNLEEAQDELVHTEKLAAIGRLVAGVAHELNNPLTSVIGYSQLALESPGDQEEMRHRLSTIFEQAQRCSRIVKDLLIFARRKNLELQQVNLCELLDESVDGLSIEFNKMDVKVLRNYSQEPVHLRADPQSIKEVFTNILSNSCDALEKVERERRIEISVSKLDGKVRISFSDNGPGIPKKIVNKIFDPFFTTKDVGKGTGLGLSLSYGIVKKHGGDLTVQSEVGQGASFIIELPVNLPMPANDEAEGNPLGQKQGTGVSAKKEIKRVLIVEDEEPIQKLILTLLRPHSYEFDTVSDGQAALKKIQNKNYDLVLCDYRIPKLDGFQLFEEVKKIKPSLAQCFIFISGSTQFIQNSESFFEENHIGCLLKPFTKEQLLGIVDATMNTPFTKS